MAKMVVITLAGEMVDTELGKEAKVVIGATEYAGLVTFIGAYIPLAVPQTSKVTIEAPGLKTTT